MSVVKALVRFVGWLLTPLVAWAASFVGAWIGATLFGGSATPMTSLWITVIFGVVSAILAALAWLRLLRKSRRLQETLALAPDGTPLAALDDDLPDDQP